MSEKNEMIKNFFPDARGREKAARDIDRKVSDCLAAYPPELVERVRRLKIKNKSLKEIFQSLGEDSRVLEIAMHLAVKRQAADIGGKQ
jgi:hypothetical protein